MTQPTIEQLLEDFTTQIDAIWLKRLREAYREGFADALTTVANAMQHAVSEADEARAWATSVSAARGGPADQP